MHSDLHNENIYERKSSREVQVCCQALLYIYVYGLLARPWAQLKKAIRGHLGGVRTFAEIQVLPMDTIPVADSRLFTSRRHGLLASHCDSTYGEILKRLEVPVRRAASSWGSAATNPSAFPGARSCRCCGCGLAVLRNSQGAPARREEAALHRRMRFVRPSLGNELGAAHAGEPTS